MALHMFRTAWDARLDQVSEARAVIREQLCDAGKQIEGLLDRIIETSSQSVIAAYEKRLEKLEREKIVLTEKLENVEPPKGRLEEGMELSLQFLARTWNIYKKCSYALRQTVLRLAFV